MALARQWTVHPDGETGEVDEDELAKALLEVSVLLRRVGGAVQMVAVREAVLGVPGERCTEAVVFQWLSRTDTRPEPEAAPAPGATEDAEQA